MEFPESISRLTLEGVLISNRPVHLWVGTSKNLGADAISFRSPPNTSVRLFENDTLKINLSDLTAELIQFGDEASMVNTNSVFGTSQEVQLVAGNSYRVEISAPGYPDLITEEMVYEVHLPLENIRFTVVREAAEDSLLCKIIGFDYRIKNNPDRDNHYLIGYFFDEDRDPIRFASVIELSDTGLETRYNPLGDGSAPCTIRAYSSEVVVVDQSWKDFVDAAEQHDEDIAGLFSNPPPIPHNVTGGYGYFGLGTAYTFPITE